nr:phosphotransferase [Bacillus pinisoli]
MTPVDFIKVVDHLNNLIFGENYYKFISPEVHFTLQHGDFFKANMLINNHTGELKIIDWVGVRLGPRWVDIALFLGTIKLPFDIIRNNFLDHDRCNYEPVEKLFFIYTLIVSWAVTFNKNEVENCFENFYSPALDYLESISLELEGMQGGKSKII